MLRLFPTLPVLFLKEYNFSVTSDAARQILARAGIEQPIKQLHPELKHNLSAPLAAVASLPQKKLTASRTSVNQPQVRQHAVKYN